MKNIFSIITFLSFSSVLGMELPDLKTLQSYINNAEKASTPEEKWMWYGKVADLSFPSTDETYREHRQLRRKASAFMYQEAKKFIDQGEYTQALKVSSYEPRSSQDLIAALKKVEPFQGQIQEALKQKKFEDIYKIFDGPELRDDNYIPSFKASIKKSEQQYYFNEAQNALNDNDPEKGFEWLGKIVDMDLYGREYLSLQEFRSKIFNELRKKALDLENEGEYDRALEIYKSAPESFGYAIKAIDGLKQLKKVIQEKKFQEAMKIILDSPAYSSKPEVQKLIPLIRIQYYTQKAREASDENEALKWYGAVADTSFAQAPTSGVDIYKDIRPLKEEAMNKISQKAIALKNQGIYNEALNLYKLAGQTFENQIEIIKKYLPFQKEIQQAMLLVNEKKYREALAIVDGQKLKNIQHLTDIAKLKMDIDAKLKLEQKEQKPTEQEKWIFLRTTDQQENLEPSDWRIIGTPPNARLELNAEAVDPITMAEFVDSIKEAQDAKIPYILFALHNDDGFYHFVDSSYFQELVKKWKNPVRGNLDAVEIYVAGEDGKLTFLNLMRNNDQMFKNMSKVEKILQKSGEGHSLIAKFFRDRGNYFRLTARDEHEVRKGEIPLQHALQWFDWAIKYLPAGTSEYKEAEVERDKILKILNPELNQPQQSTQPKQPQQPARPPKKPTEPIQPTKPQKPTTPKKPQEPPQSQQQSQTFLNWLLIQNLQSLTRSLQKMVVALSN